MKKSEQYAKALRDGDHARCIRIEEEAGLYGYPTELVSLGLVEIEAGRDPSAAINEKLEGAQ